MKKHILAAVIGVYFIGVVFIYSVVLQRIKNEISKDYQKTVQNVTNLYFIHWLDFPEEIFESFHMNHSDIHVNFEKISKSNYHEIIKARIASAHNTDIMGVLFNDYEEFVIRGYLVDLSEKKYLFNYDEESRIKIRNKSLSKREYAIPYHKWITGIWYNKVLFNKYDISVPESLEDLKSACSILKQKGVSPIIGGTGDEMTACYFLIPWFARIKKYDENSWIQKINSGEMKWTDPQVEEIFKDIHDFIQQDFIDIDVLKISYFQAFQHFINGGAAMIIADDSLIKIAEQYMPNIEDFGVFSISGNNSSTIFGNDADGLTGIFSRANNKQEADLFLEYISNHNAGHKFYKYSGITPPIKDLVLQQSAYEQLWMPLKKKKLVSADITELEYEMLLLLNNNLKQLFSGEKNYKQVCGDLQQRQDALKIKRY